jgi:molecular chaperone DnaJ
VSIKFEEAAFGAERKIKIRRVVRCEHCKASGAEPGTKIIECSVCKGVGEIKDVKRTVLGQIVTSRVCDKCNGEGKSAEKPCATCNGHRRLSREKMLTVKIPQGINDNAVIRLAGEGNEGLTKGNDGNLYIRVQVEPSKKYKRDGYDIHTDTEIHALQAILGDEIEVETLHGKETLIIAPGTQNDKVIRLSGKGVPKMDSKENGDHFVKVRVYMPKKISKKEREYYLKLAEESGLEIKPGKSGLLW